MAAQSDPENMRRLNWRESLPDWLRRSPPKSSADGSASTPQGSPAETVAKSSEEASPSSPASSSAGSPDAFPPLTISKIGDTVRINRPPDEMVEWTNADFACLFLRWLAREYSTCRNGWVSVFDIETEFFPRFQEAAQCYHLGCGALYRGLGEVTQKRDRRYTEFSGKRCSMTEYLVPDPAAAVVEIAGRKRA